MTTTTYLLHDQRVALAVLLQTRLASMEVARESQLDGKSQVAAAHDTLLQDADDACQRAGDHEVEDIKADIDSDEFKAVSNALQRIHRADYGVCVDCQKAIPFGRLSIEPQALRCAACQTIHELEFHV